MDPERIEGVRERLRKGIAELKEIISLIENFKITSYLAYFSFCSED